MIFVLDTAIVAVSSIIFTYGLLILVYFSEYY